MPSHAPPCSSASIRPGSSGVPRPIGIQKQKERRQPSTRQGCCSANSIAGFHISEP
jgi:hypothetical protein